MAELLENYKINPEFQNFEMWNETKYVTEYAIEPNNKHKVTNPIISIYTKRKSTQRSNYHGVKCIQTNTGKSAT